MSNSSTPGPAEYLDDAQPRRRDRAGWVAGATAAAVLVAGAGALAVAQFLGAGPAPATAVPDDALVYVALDLDPSGSQKLEALRTLRKFPAIRDDLGLDGTDDLRRWLYEGLTAEEPCPDLDFAEDVDPWLGDKVALSARPAGAGGSDGADGPVMFFVVQVKDQELATEGIAQIAECADEDPPGTAFTGDFMVVAETQSIADGIVADAEQGSLADDDAFDRWIGEAGGAGILEAYLSADAPAALSDTVGVPTPDDLGGLTGGDVGAEVSPASLSTAPAPGVDAFEDFQGGAMVVRFDNGALEMEMAAGGLPAAVEAGGDSGIDDLPATTALAVGFGVPDGAVQDMLDAMGEMSGMSEDDVDAMLAEAEDEMGLDLPEDLQTMLGDGLSVAVDSSMDFGAVLEGSAPDGTDLPVGVRIVGDPTEITPVLDKVRSALGPVAADLVVEEGDGVVAVGLDADYVATLADDGSLGEGDRFQAALGDVENRAGGLYVDFDAGDWLTKMAETDPDGKVRENVEPLDSLGVTGWMDGDVVHGQVRLTTD